MGFGILSSKNAFIYTEIVIIMMFEGVILEHSKLSDKQQLMENIRESYRHPLRVIGTRMKTEHLNKHYYTFK